MTLNGFHERLLIGYESGHVELWCVETSTARCLASLKMFPDSLMCLDYHSGVNRGLAGSVSQELVFFDVAEDAATPLHQRRQVSAPNAGFAVAQWRKDGRIVAAE